MSEQSNEPKTSRLGTASRWTWIVVGIALIYTASVLFMRSRETKAIEEESERKVAKTNQEIIDKIGVGGALKISMFYGNPGVVQKGGKGLLCYGVVSAKTVKIEPDVEALQPSLSRCVEIRPQATTKYTLTATDEAGKVETQSLEIQVH